MTDKPSVHETIIDIISAPEPDPAAGPLEARKKAMDYLARREYGRKELCSKLAGAGFEADHVEAAVEQLAAEGLQSDHRFAEAFVQSRINQGKGPVRIRADLSQRGLDDNLIEDVLHESGASWRELAAEVRRKKFGAAEPVNFKDKAKQMRFLQYRGFESGHIQAAIAADDDV